MKGERIAALEERIAHLESILKTQNQNVEFCAKSASVNESIERNAYLEKRIVADQEAFMQIGKLGDEYNRILAEHNVSREKPGLALLAARIAWSRLRAHN